MNRVLIIGSNGAGKTTFSYALAQKTGLPLIHIDQIYWQTGWQVTPSEEIDLAVLEYAQGPRWIIEGNNIRSLHLRLPFADTLFWFEFSPLVCLWNILLRHFQWLGKTRPDLPDGCESHLTLAFLRSAWGFNRKNRQTLQTLLQQHPHLRAVRFTRRAQVKAYLTRLSEHSGRD